MKVTTWVLGAVLTAAPVMYAQQAQDQQPSAPLPPAASQQSNNGQASGNVQPNAGALPQSNQGAQSENADQNVNSATSSQDQSAIYGTGMTAAELKQAGYDNSEIAQLRNESAALMASNMATPGSASGNQDQAPSSANGVSRPADMNNDASGEPTKAQSSHAGLWGLLGLLGLLGLGGRAKRQVVVRRDADTLADTDRTRGGSDREDAARDREIVAANERNREIAAANRDRVRTESEREDAQRAERDRDLATRERYRNQDVLSDSELQERQLRDELRDRRDRKITEIDERDRDRRRTA